MTVVKLCGTTSFEDAAVAVEAGADLLGFILYPKSPRYVTPDAVADIVSSLRARYASLPLLVGVFVNATPADISAVLAETGLDLAQLHGDEPAAAFAALGRRAFKAIRPTSLAHALELGDRYAPLAPASGPHLLVDAYDANAYGGTGQRADWDTAAVLARRVDRLLLAGGLTPERVADAVAAVQPWGVDVASGVEQAPGRKDHAKVRAFVDAAKRAGALTT